MKKMTPWFPSNIKPVHQGVYRIRNWSDGNYAYFNGKRWGWANLTVKSAQRYKGIKGAAQDKEWRGFTEEQK